MNHTTRRASSACAALAVTIAAFSAGAQGANAATRFGQVSYDRCASLRTELAYLLREYKTNPSPLLAGEIRTIEGELDQFC